MRWRFKTGSEIFSSPAVDTAGKIIFGSEDSFIYCLSKDGSLLWKFPTTGFIVSSPAISGQGKIYIGSDDGKIYALGRKIVK